MAAERVEQALDELGKRMQSVEKQHDELVQRLQTYEKLAADTVRTEISKVTGGLNDLYTKADAAIGSLAIRVQALEKSYIQGARQKTSLLNAKDMKPKELEKEEDWRRWKADVEDCVEEIMPGMKDILEKVKTADREIDEQWFGADADGWWARGESLWRFLRRYTGTDARRVVSGVSDNNGWEAWRQLNQQYEPSTAAREAHVMTRVLDMMKKRAKNPKETKMMMAELNERSKRAEEITGKTVDEDTLKGVIAGFLDESTRLHTAQFQGTTTNLGTFRRKIMEFANAVSVECEDRMDINRVQGQTSMVWEQEEESDANEMEDHLGRFGEKCHRCGGIGHYARECPTRKGEGKGSDGKGKGPQGTGGGKGEPNKGKGKGKATGPQGGCWTCGGAHLQRNCPRANGGQKGTSKGASSQIRTLSALRALKAPICTRNRFEVLGSLEEEPEESHDAKRGVVNPVVQVEVQARKTYVEAVLQRRKGDTASCSRNMATTGGRWRTGGIATLREVIPPGMNSMEETGWEEIDMVVDSGATDTVVGEDMLQSIKTTPGLASKRGVQYEVANGDLVPNLGEKQFIAEWEDGQKRGLTAQVCDVNKALLSVRKMVQAGNRVVFDAEGSYIEDKETGECLKLQEQGGMYTLKLWVQTPFQGQAR